MSTSAVAPSPSALFPASRSTLIPAAAAAGIVLGVVYTLSPMTVWFAVASALIVMMGTRGLAEGEAAFVRRLLVLAIAVRVLLVAGLLLFGTSDHMWFNTFFGDEQYLLVRSMRLRQFWLGTSMSLEAFFDLFDLYGQTSYIDVIAFAQVLIGPAPYGIHLLNSAFYLVGAILLHRLIRSAFGRVPAAIALVGLLFLPSLLVWSASGLKESLTFLVVTCVLTAAVAFVRAGWVWRPLAALIVVAGLAALRTFRAGAFEITAVGVALGLAGGFITRRLWRVAIVIAMLAALAVSVSRSERIHTAALTILRPAAGKHLGHVFTRGHAYKLLDQRLYDSRITDSMTWSEAVRFVRRSIVSVVLYPLPWESQSTAELLYVPEQIVWYLILLTALGGVAAGIRRDALVTSILLAYATAALAVVALNTGNIGTLVRHRAFALPYLIALSAVGVTAAIGRLSSSSRRAFSTVR